jgi:hypothetical protein
VSKYCTVAAVSNCLTGDTVFWYRAAVLQYYSSTVRYYGLPLVFVSRHSEIEEGRKKERKKEGTKE